MQTNEVKETTQSTAQSNPQKLSTTTNHPAEIIQRAQADPGSLTHADIMTLHRTIGNKAVATLISGIMGRKESIQRKPNQNDNLESIHKEDVLVVGEIQESNGENSSIQAVFGYLESGEEIKLMEIVGKKSSDDNQLYWNSLGNSAYEEIGRKETGELIVKPYEMGEESAYPTWEGEGAGEEIHFKFQVAKEFEKILGNMGFGVFLAGGGAITALGSGREIKDLDFKMGEKLKQIWLKPEENQREDIAKEILQKMGAFGKTKTSNVGHKKTFPYVFRFVLTTPEGEVEISLTRTGEFGTLLQEESVDMHMIGPIDLILEKAFAFAERNVKNLDKLSTDCTDLAHLLKNYSVTQEDFDEHVLIVRTAGYDKKIAKMNFHENIDQQIIERLGFIENPEEEKALVRKFAGLLDGYVKAMKEKRTDDT